ncbi:BTB/POZ domain-containing protein [Spinellus fusiger]|nr:BTB/POZ domain-containing protein [Spinellus fusiger]
MVDALKYLDNDSLTISVKFEEVDNHQLKVKPNPMIQAPLQFDDMFISQFHDVAIRVFESEEESETGDEDVSNGQVFHSFKLILALSSPFFKKLFKSGIKEYKEKEIILRGVDPKVFERVIDYVHTNKIDIGSIKDCANLLKEADKFTMERLTAEVAYHLQLRINCSTLWKIWNIAGKSTSDTNDYNLIELEETCVAFMRSDCVDLFADPGWINVKESVALKALQINNLQTNVNESVFYEAVLRWRESNLKKLEYIDSQNPDKIIEQKISSLKSQLKDIKIVQASNQDDSVENEQEADTLKDITQPKKSAREEIIAKWKNKNATLSKIDKIFASMIYCIRFTQIKDEYIATIVESNVDVMRVIGIDYLLREALCYKFKKNEDIIDEELKSRFIQK